VIGRGWVACTPDRSTRAPIGMLFNDTGVSGEPVDEAKQAHAAILCSLLGRSSTRCADRSARPPRPRDRPPARLVTATVAMLAKDPAMGGKQIAAKLDISLSRLARVFKAEMGMSLVEYRNRLRWIASRCCSIAGARTAGGGAGGGLRQLRPVSPRLPRPAPHDTARYLHTRGDRTEFRTLCNRSGVSYFCSSRRRRSAASATAGRSLVRRQQRTGGERERDTGTCAGARAVRPAHPTWAAAWRGPSGAPGGLTSSPGPASAPRSATRFDDTTRRRSSTTRAAGAWPCRMTFYLITGKTPEIDNAIWSQDLKDGHELGSHSRSHRTRAQPPTSTRAPGHPNKFGVTVYTMAAPFGDPSYIALAAARYLINRGVNDGNILPNGNTDPFNFNCFVPATGAAASAFNNAIDAGAEGRRLEDRAGPRLHGRQRQRVPAGRDRRVHSSVNYAKALGDVWIDTVLNVAAYWRRRRCFRRSRRRPREFADMDVDAARALPARKVLRVRVDGGTLTQPADGR
jgi:hypothetical protein